MRLTRLALATLLVLPALLAVAPAAEARPAPPTCIRECGPIVPVDVCVAGATDPACYRGDACVTFSRQVPFCADVPCWNPVDCVALECETKLCDPCWLWSCQPLVGVCVDDVTGPGCYRDAWICVGFSYQIPFCVDHVEVACDACDVPVAASGGPEKHCMEYYYEHDNGAVRYVQRDSCTSELYVMGERVK